ncbi:EEF1A lysine methyltransferase 2 [Brevipalpus obovatus]|uniref:EEF1A lysine methyltransferase 2 n=1 Tax=Brevipalpus obovatus TaxID=246614 RepID=UPI003D9E5B0B
MTDDLVSSVSDATEDTPKSQLGTIDFWEKNYELELKNYETHQDPGEIWFGCGLKSKIVRWIMNNVTDEGKCILDIGCGNGHMLVDLAKQGNFSKLIGIDYAPSSIELARKVFENESILNKKLELFVVDFLRSNSVDKKVDIIIDKGTFDAICLNPEINIEDSRGKYIKSLVSLLNQDGIFLIASCNWTREELLKIFEHSGPFQLHDSIDTPCIQFGGKKGNNVTCLIFKSKR